MVRMFVWIGAIGLTLSMALPVWAFECPKHFADAQAAIDRATAAMQEGPKGEKMALVHTLIDDAKMLLMSGKHNHEKPQGTYDHARAIAKADSAHGYAGAAELLAKR